MSPPPPSPIAVLSGYHQIQNSFSPVTLPGIKYFAITKGQPITQADVGPKGVCSFTLGAAIQCNLVDTAGAFGTAAANSPNNMFVTITGATSAGNNGTFLITNNGTTSVTYNNAGRVAEAFSGVWRIHGRIDSITDMIGPYVFTQTVQNPNKMAINPSVLNGHSVGCSLGPSTFSARRHYILSSAPVAGAFNGAAQFSMGVYAKIVVQCGTGPIDFQGVTDNTGTYTNCDRHQMPSTVGITLSQRSSAPAGTSNFTEATSMVGAWKLLTCTYDGAGNMKFYDGATLISTKTLAHRGPIAQTFVVLGEAALNTVAREVYEAGWFGATGGQFTATQLTPLLAWFQATYA